jgi:hypothetical protein
VTPRFTGRPSDGCSAGPIGANERRREVSASDVSVATREPRPGSSLPPDDTPSRSARALRAGQSDRASRSRSAHPSPIRGTRRAPSVRSRPGSSGGPGQSGHPWSDAAASPRNRRDAANPLEPRGMRARHRGDRGSSTSRDVILERSWNARAASRRQPPARPSRREPAISDEPRPMGTDGESPHRICKPEVTGSIPVRSTFVRPRKRGLSVFQAEDAGGVRRAKKQRRSNIRG